MLKLFKYRGMVDTLTKEVEKLKKENKRLKDRNVELGVINGCYYDELQDSAIKLEEYKTSNILLEKEILKKDQQLKLKESQRRKNACKVGGLTKENNKLKEENKEFKKKIKELEKELDKRYILKTLKPTKPTKQKMSIKSSTVQSKIIKDLKGDYDENN